MCVRQDSAPAGFSSGDVLIPLADEYDPMFPNDYEKVVKRQREERQRQREQERQKEIEEREKYVCILHQSYKTYLSPVDRPLTVKLSGVFLLL